MHGWLNPFIRNCYSRARMKREGDMERISVERNSSASVAVIIPCHDEELTIGTVVADFARALPEARIVVVDNASKDRTSKAAAAAGARVIFEPRLGKGFAVLCGLRSEHAADYFLIVDGDDTYPAERAPDLIAAAAAGADMVIGARNVDAEEGAFRTGHSFGNQLFVLLVRLLFGLRTRDLLSGYRVLTRRFLENAPLIAKGFEVEAELSLQAKVQELPVTEVSVCYRPRPVGSDSKLRTFRDGYQVLIAIVTFFRDYRPIAFFGTLSILLMLGSVAGLLFVTVGSGANGALASFSMTLLLLSALSLTCGVILSSINRRAAEITARITWR
jgi:glycosyltransferase involved in cell wall biosynthesis